MLSIIYYENPEDWWDCYTTCFDPHRDLWILGSVDQKILVERHHFAHNLAFYGSSHPRIHDWLWDIFQTLYGTNYIRISRGYFAVWAKENFECIGQDIGEANSRLAGYFMQSSDMLVEWICFLGSLALSDEDSSAQLGILTEFLEHNQNSKVLWGELYVLAWQMSHYVFHKKKWVLDEWLAKLCQKKASELSHANLGQKLFFDLGSMVKGSILKLLEDLSRQRDVFLLIPKLNRCCAKFYFDSEIPLQYRMVGLTQKKLTTVSGEKDSDKVIYVKTSSVHQATDHLIKITQDLLDSGICEDQIAWYFIDYEKILPYLLLKTKSIFSSFEVGGYWRLADLKETQILLSYLRILSGSFGILDLECIFRETITPDFKSRYSLVQEFEELPEDIKSKIISHSKLDRRTKIKCLEFIEWLFSESAVKNEIFVLRKILPNYLSEIPMDELLSVQSWSIWLQKRIQSDFFSELPFTGKSFKGIHICRYGTFFPKQVTHVFLFDCNLESLKPNPKSFPIKNSEIDLINLEYGFELDHPDISRSEFDFFFLLGQKNLKRICFFYSKDFQDSPLTEHPIFHIIPKVDQPIISPLLKRSESCETREPDDLSISNTPFQKLPWSVSVTQLESLLRCGIKFYFEKRIKLTDVSGEPMEPDPICEGAWVHKVFEAIINEIKINITADKIEQIVEEQFESLEHRCKNPFLRLKKAYVVEIAKKFYEIELKLRKTCPGLVTVACEKEFEIYLDLSKSEFVWEEPSHQQYVKINGKIDRLDKVILNEPIYVKGQEIHSLYLVIDYKRSDSNLKTWRDWEKWDQWQLFIYGKALPKILKTERPPVIWAGSRYYIYRKFYYLNAMVSNELLPFLDEKTRKSKNTIYLCDQIPMFDEVARNLTKAIVGKILRVHNSDISKQWVTKENRKLCENCSWRYACRAPHL